MTTSIFMIFGFSTTIIYFILIHMFFRQEIQPKNGGLKLTKRETEAQGRGVGDAISSILTKSSSSHNINRSVIGTKEEEEGGEGEDKNNENNNKPAHLLLLEQRYPLESQDPYLRHHLQYLTCTDVPCHQQLPDIFWQPIRLPTKTQKDLILKFEFAKRFIDECGQITPSHLLQANLVLLTNSSAPNNQDCGWGTKNSDFQNIAIHSTSNAYDRVLPLLVPNGHLFQHFIDGVLPKIMMNWDAIRKLNISVYVSNHPDAIVTAMIKKLGIQDDKASKALPPIVGKKLYNGCVAPPLHPILWRRARAFFIGPTKLRMMNLPTNNGVDDDKRHIILVKRTKENTRNPGRLIKNYEELRDSLKAKYDIRLVEYDSKDHTLESTIDLWSNAAAVIASHGGALSNLIFCMPNTVVVESMPVKEDGSLYLKHGGMMFYVFSSLLGLNYWRMMSTSGGADVIMPPDEVLNILNNPTRELDPNESDLIMSPLHKDCLNQKTC